MFIRLMFVISVITSFFGPPQLIILVQFTRGKLACSDGVRQAPGSSGICYSKTIQLEDREYTASLEELAPTVEFNAIT